MRVRAKPHTIEHGQASPVPHPALGATAFGTSMRLALRAASPCSPAILLDWFPGEKGKAKSQ